MFSNNKIKIIILVLIILAVSVLGLRHCSKLDKPSAQQKPTAPNKKINNESEKDHLIKVIEKGFQQIKSSEKTGTDTKIPNPVSNAELEGVINKEFGIRQDILLFIEKSIPSDNIKAKTAAIKMSYYDNQIYHHSSSVKEALEWESKSMLATFCFSLAAPNEWLKTSEGIEKLMRDTPQRDKHLWDVADKFFASRVLGTGLNDAEERARCETGQF